MVLNFILVFGGDQPQQGTNTDCQNLTGQHQHQCYIHARPQHLTDRNLVREGFPKISLEHVSNVKQQLLPKRLVQAELGCELRDIFIRRCLPCQADADDRQDHRYHLQQPSCNVLAKFHRSHSPFPSSSLLQ